MKRREFMQTLGFSAAALAATRASAGAPAAAKAKPEAKSDVAAKVDGGKTDEGKTDNKQSAILDEIAKTTAECKRAGEACLAHCARELTAGNTSLAGCYRSVTNMLAMVQATGTLALHHTAKPEYLKSAIQLCAQLCEQCTLECEKHASHHSECRACLEACRACMKACKAY